MANPATVAIIDYQMSNLFSVQHACEFVGLRSKITSDPADLKAADALILPGVGAFGDAMNNLRRLELDTVILKSIAQKKPFMGICLGLQLLFTRSEEFGEHEGLNIIPGLVKKFPDHYPDGRVRKVPQIGWNMINPARPTADWAVTPLRQVRPGSFMYFVHSYYVIPDRAADQLCQTTYEGIEYCSGVGRDNVFAVQFHPEKSGPEGIKIYRDWALSVQERSS